MSKGPHTAQAVTSRQDDDEDDGGREGGYLYKWILYLQEILYSEISSPCFSDESDAESALT